MVARTMLADLGTCVRGTPAYGPAARRISPGGAAKSVHGLVMTSPRPAKFWMVALAVVLPIAVLIVIVGLSILSTAPKQMICTGSVYDLNQRPECTLGEGPYS